MARLIFLCWIIITGSQVYSAELPAPEELSPGTRATLLTCGPGHQLYSHFGHTAIRILNPMQGIDITFNYGMFDYSDPNFAVKFAKREMQYFLAVSRTGDFLAAYHADKRYVYEQPIQLNGEGIKVLYTELYNDFTHEDRRFYLYEFFYDNCATRPRDVLAKAARSEDPDFIWAKHEDAGQYTFRELIDTGFYETPWIDFGIDLVLGAPIDKICDNKNLMFLPGYVAEIGRMSEVNGKTLLGEKKFIAGLDFDYEVYQPTRSTPQLVFWLLLGLMIFFTAWLKNPEWMKYVDLGFFLVFGLLSILLILMWFSTAHPGTKANFNLIWATPLHLVSVILILVKKWRNKIPAYFIAMAGLLLVFVLTFWLMPQGFHPAIKPIVLLLAFRYFALHRMFYQQRIRIK